jgi:hypothetical protein
MVLFLRFLGISLIWVFTANAMEMPEEPRGTKRPVEEEPSIQPQKKTKAEVPPPGSVILDARDGRVIFSRDLAMASHTLRGLIEIHEAAGGELIFPLESIESDTLLMLFLLVTINKQPVSTFVKPEDIERMKKDFGFTANTPIAAIYPMAPSKLSVLNGIKNRVENNFKKKQGKDFFNSPTRDGNTRPYAFVDLLKALNFLDIPELNPIVAGIAAVEIHNKGLKAEDIKNLDLGGLGYLYYDVAKQYFIIYRNGVAGHDREIRDFLNKAFGYEWGLTMEEVKKYNMMQATANNQLANIALGSMKGITAEMLSEGGYLDLKGNNFTYLKRGDFDHLGSRLIGIDLSDNPLIGIEEGTFTHLTQLKSLNLSRTQFTSIARDDELTGPRDYNLDPAVLGPVVGTLEKLLLGGEQLQIVGDTLLSLLRPGTALFFMRGQESLVINKSFVYTSANLYNSGSNDLQLRNMQKMAKSAFKGFPYFIYFFLDKSWF